MVAQIASAAQLSRMPVVVIACQPRDGHRVVAIAEPTAAPVKLAAT
jgi:hypothetical protein